jgi:hypothetical protein
MSTTPVIFDDGSKALVSADQLSAALKDGGKIAQPMIFDDGSKGFVTLDRVHEAMQDGGKLIGTPPKNPVPAELQPGMVMTNQGPMKYADAVKSQEPGVAESAMGFGSSISDTLKDSAKAPLLGAATIAPMVTGGASIPVQMTVGAASGAAQSKLLGGDNAEAGTSAAVGAALPTLGPAVKAVAPYAGSALRGIAGSIDPDIIGLISPRAASAQRMLGKIGSVIEKLNAEPPVYPGAPLPEHPGTFPGAPLPETPAPEQLNPSLVSPSRTLPGMNGPEVIRPTIQPSSPIPPRAGLQLTGEVAPQAATAVPEPMTMSANGNTIPRTMSGDSALRQILTGQDNANLLKIAKSRGINVTREALLKPGSADNLIINKIINDFSPDELNEVSAQYLENNRFRHNFGDIGAEAWKTLGLKSYFPDMKIPAAQLNRTQAAIEAAVQAAPAGDDSLLNALQESLKKAKAAKLATAQ